MAWWTTPDTLMSIGHMVVAIGETLDWKWFPRRVMDAISSQSWASSVGRPESVKSYRNRLEPPFSRGLLVLLLAALIVLIFLPQTAPSVVSSTRLHASGHNSISAMQGQTT